MAKNSPGIYTKETDLTFVTKQVGVTTLGLVGETTIGPAFQPIFISNYDDFRAYFGGLNATKVKDTGAPLYELPYIAKSYLSQANQLYVTRVLGLSGFDAGYAWGITLDGAVDPATTGITINSTNYSPLISFTASSAGTLVSVVSTDPIVQELYNSGQLNSSLAFLPAAATGSTATISPTYIKNGSTFTGASFNLYVTSSSVVSGQTIGTASGATINYSGTAYTDVENKVVALLRSRGGINSSTQLPSFEVTGNTGVVFDPTITAATYSPLGDFTLSGNSAIQGLFSYSVSMDRTKNNYLPKVLGRTAQDGKTAIFVEEAFENMFTSLNAAGKIKGIKLTMVNYSREYFDYLTEYKSAVTPYIVSELRGNKVLRLFRFITISDGNAANEQFKISISGIRPDTKEFDVQIRAFYDTDASPSILETFSRCTMDPNSNNFIGRRIGTNDGFYPSKSNYVTVELDDTSDTSTAFPAGYIGYPIRNYQANSNTTVANPTLLYKSSYTTFENKRKAYLGLSNTTGIDADFFDYKGVPNSATIDQYTGLTNGFHMDSGATGATIDNVKIVIDATGGTYSPIFLFEVGADEFRNETDLVGGPYEKIYARKFTLVPFGGFDGWDIYRSSRSNSDRFLINGINGAAGLTSGSFVNRPVSNGDNGINSDYYAYLEGILTFSNPKEIDINVFSTPGIDTINNSNLVEAAIEMIEQDRQDALYVVTTPDTDSSGDLITADDITDSLDGMYDSNYTATYYPWVQINDSENNVYIYIPPTADVMKNIALTDKISNPWFSVGGTTRGRVNGKARARLTSDKMDTLYDNRVNPIATFASEGTLIWGNKTLQIRDSALNRINVRRLLLQTKRLISAVSLKLIFEQNDAVVRNQFLSLVNPILENIRTERGLNDFRVEITSDPEDLDRNSFSARIFIKPTRALEQIFLDFVITPNGVSFSEVQ